MVPDTVSRASQALPVFVTRPEPQASAWCRALQVQLDARFVPEALPLIDIGPVTLPAAQARLREVGQDLASYAAAFFVSIPAVRYFMASLPGGVTAWNAAGVRAWAPGRGTWQALHELGVRPDLIDSPPPEAAQFDSETLWPLVRPQLEAARHQGQRVLRVRGADSQAECDPACAGAGRDWLGTRVREEGVALDTVVAYLRQPPVWDPLQRERMALQVQQPSLWVWSSSQALTHLHALLPGQNWQQAVAIVTHPRIGEAAGRMGFGRVVSSRPTVEDVVRSIQSVA